MIVLILVCGVLTYLFVAGALIYRLSLAKTARDRVGIGLLMVIFIGLPIAVPISYVARQAYWNKKVLEMCAHDGGVHVHQRVPISEAAYNALPKLDGKYVGIPMKAGVSPSPLYGTITQSFIQSGDPEVYRLETLVRRRGDDAIVGKIITYTRRGGDIPSPGHPSSFSCPDRLEIYAAQAQFYEVRKKEQ